MTKKLLIYGCGYPSITSLIKYLNMRGEHWEIVGYLDDSKYGRIDNYYGYPVIGDHQCISDFVDEGYYFFNNVASSTKSMETVFQKLEANHAKICTFVFPEPPDIDLETVIVGLGTIISPRVIVGVDVVFGKNVIVRQQTIISHNSRIGDYCFIGPNVGVMGEVTIGDKTFIGAKALIRNNVTIGKNCVIGMGAVVTKDIPDNTTVVGNPAKPIYQFNGRKKVKAVSNIPNEESANNLFITKS